MPMLRTLLLALCLCLAPYTPHAEGLFIIDDGMPSDDGLNALQIIPVTSSNQKMSPAYARAAALYRENDAQGAAALREHALNGDMDALFALAALSRLAEAEKRPLLFGAPAAFWEDWAVRMLGEKEAWFRIGAALFECGMTDGLPKATLGQMAKDALRKAARLGHPEAMYGLAYLSEAYPDKDFHLPNHPDFFIFPQNIEEYGFQTRESRYWMGAAAAHGSARANFVFGLVFTTYNSNSDTEQKAIEAFGKSMRLGMVHAAVALEGYLLPFLKEQYFRRYASCRSGLYYGIICAKMSDEYDMIESKHWAEAMIQGNNEYFPEACLTQKEYEDTVREAEQEFERIKADMLARKEAHDALYAKAQPMFAEMRDAFAALAKEKTAPAEKKATN